VDICAVSGFEPETVEETFERLRRAEARGESESGVPASGVGDEAAAREYPVPAGDPMPALQAYELSWKPDALVLLHPEMFGGGGAQTQVEVAVFALADWGLVRLSLQSGWRRFVVSSLLISRVEGLAGDNIGTKPGSAWASDAILAKVYDPYRGQTWSGRGLYRLKTDPGDAALVWGMASKEKLHWWKPASIVAQPEASQASVAASRGLAQRWDRFTSDYPALHKAITSAATTPEAG
jgi:hypothetical protein